MTATTWRDLLKQRAPKRLIGAVRRVRAAVAPPPIDEAVLGDYRFAADPAATPRLTLAIPDLDPANAYGGVNTCVDLLLQLHRRLRAETGSELRILTEARTPLADTALPALARATFRDGGGGDPLDGVTLAFAPRGAEVAARRRELFMAYNWWTGLNLQPLVEAHAAHYGVALPRLQLLQDYEPHMMEFSSGSLLARQAFNLDWPLWVVFNSAELRAYYLRMGDRADRAYVFEPVMNPALRPLAEDLGATPRKRQVLVYARPQVARNCWPILRRALALWAREPASAGWTAVSAGAAHPPEPLGDGRSLTPLGKLTLDGYGRLLRETAVGLSLMASPHPSYPPLEMAHFGLRVVTNRFADKDLSRRHDNIAAPDDVRPAALARALAAACAAFDADPGAGARARSHMPGYAAGGFDCLDALTGDLLALWREA